jgi:hypothetical protein
MAMTFSAMNSSMGTCQLLPMRRKIFSRSCTSWAAPISTTETRPTAATATPVKSGFAPRKSRGQELNDALAANDLILEAGLPPKWRPGYSNAPWTQRG